MDSEDNIPRKITINGKEWQCYHSALSYTDVIKMTGFPMDKLYTIKWCLNETRGILTPTVNGEGIPVFDGMEFAVE